MGSNVVRYRVRRGDPSLGHRPALLLQGVRRAAFVHWTNGRGSPFVTETPTVQAILTHIGEASEAPPISPCRGPPEWEMLDQTVEFDPIHPEPEYNFDQSLTW
jgi:hypothetical protein